MLVELQAEVGYEAAKDGGCEFMDVADVPGIPVPNHGVPYKYTQLL